MRNACFILLLSLLCIRASAATTVPVRSVVFRTYAVDTMDKLTKLKAELKYYRGMRASGAGITAAGGVLFLSGQGMFWSSIALNQSGRRSYTPTARDPLWLAGLGTTLLSAVPFAFGIPLLRYGVKKCKKLKIEIRAKEKKLGNL